MLTERWSYVTDNTPETRPYDVLLPHTYTYTRFPMPMGILREGIEHILADEVPSTPTLKRSVRREMRRHLQGSRRRRSSQTFRTRDHRHPHAGISHALSARVAPRQRVAVGEYVSGLTPLRRIPSAKKQADRLRSGCSSHSARCV